MSQYLTESIKYLFDRYSQAKTESITKHPVAEYIRNTIPQNLRETGLIDERKYTVDASPGQMQNWAQVPWMGIFRTEITSSAQEGVYIVYLLSADGNNLFLTFNQGYTDIAKDKNTKETVNTMRERAANCIKILNRHSFNFDENISLGNDLTPRAKMYQRGTIFYKEYQKHDLPSEETLKKDLKDMLEIYEEYYEKIFKENGSINPPSNHIPNESIMPHNQIFFGAPGTGKSYKVDSLLPKESVWNLTGEERKNLFLCSEIAKKEHYADVLSDETKFGGDVWNMDEFPLLEKKLSEVDSNDNVKNPEHSALQAYIKFLKEYKFEQKVFRTTFHPDYDYSQFVGAYKPKKAGNTITYAFVPQIFAKAYVAAWKKYLKAGSVSTIANQVYLVIEEINRGNCAQIFGDIFQLLDRVGSGPDKGFSQYPIDIDSDFAEWLVRDDDGLRLDWQAYINDWHVKVNRLVLPPNLNILATMNTSDQSLFPMDSAFKRRFDWEYVPIKYAKDSDCGDDWKADEFKIVIGNSTYMWLDFLKKVNADIYDATQSEDKQMGEFFIKPKTDDLKIAFNEFRSKVLFYLWDSVYKDETERQAVFLFPYGDGDGKINSVTFQSLFGKDAEAIVNKIMENLKVEKVTA